MMRLNLFLRTNSNINKVHTQAFLQRSFSTSKNSNITISSSSSSSSSSDSSSDDEQKKSLHKQKRTEAREKLNSLLNHMIQDKYPKLELAKPKNQRQKDVRTEPGTKSIKQKPVEQQVVEAVKDVAKSVGGDVKQTESELLQKLLSTEEKQPTTATNLSDIFKDMKIDRETKASEEVSRAHQVRQLLNMVKSDQKSRRPKSATQKTSRYPRKPAGEINILDDRVDLFGSDRLGIFPSREEVDKWENPELNKTWKNLYERELRLAVTHPPANYFQQMALWTEQKKLWRFPIDNEQDLEEEKKVYFTEHVFLEKHLEPWCPPKGPLRHFMELVCVGLSKNYYLTIEQKKEHIEWFRNYFVEKKKVLTEVGAIPANFKIDQEGAKEIEG